jgi:hypothetical protein
MRMKFSASHILPVLGAFVMIGLAAMFTKRPTTLPSALTQATPSAQITTTASISGNLLSNPSFENERPPWFSMESWKTNFTLSDEQAHTGSYSALLEFDTDTAASQAGEVHGVVQEMKPAVFPEKISGWYYVENWQRGTLNQYLQFAVIVFESKNIPELAKSSKNHQIRFLLAGVENNPFDIRNAKFVFVGKKQPELGKWVYFERNIKQDFLKEWGNVPQGYTNIRFFFEARWDGRKPGEGRVAAKVYFDDLYVGD